MSACAQHAVTKAAAPDYNQYVPAAREMTLDTIERRLKGAKYGSGAALRADVAQIAANAAAYNAPGCGRYGGPGRAPCLPCWKGLRALHTGTLCFSSLSLRIPPVPLVRTRTQLSNVSSGIWMPERCNAFAEPGRLFWFFVPCMCGYLWLRQQGWVRKPCVTRGSVQVKSKLLRADIPGMAEMLVAALDAELGACAAELANAEAAVRHEERAAARGAPRLRPV